MSPRIALVTGGSQGVGLAVVTALAARGYLVAMVSRSQEHLDGALAGLPPEQASRVAAFSADVRHRDSIAAAIDAVAERFGGLDVVINCAGVSMRARDRFRDTEPAEWRRIIETNLDGTYHVLHAALPHLERSTNAHVVTMLSTGAWKVGQGTSIYAASKFGARALTEALIEEYRGSRIRISSVSPGPIDTTIWTHKRVEPTREERATMLRPADVADIFVWLVEQPRGVHVRDVTVTPWRAE